MPLTLHLLRHAVHGHPADMLCGRMAGVRLGAEGQRQAELLAPRFPPGSLDGLRTSPVGRCRETTAALERVSGLPAVVDPAAEEVDFGGWTGRRFAELDQDPLWRSWNRDRDRAGSPGGETMVQVRDRVAGLMESMLARHPHSRVAVVTHAEIVRTAVLLVLGLPLQAYERIEVSPASITTLCLWPGGGRLLGLNDVSHLAAEVPIKEMEPA